MEYTTLVLALLKATMDTLPVTGANWKQEWGRGELSLTIDGLDMPVVIPLNNEQVAEYKGHEIDFASQTVASLKVALARPNKS